MIYDEILKTKRWNDLYSETELEERIVNQSVHPHVIAMMVHMESFHFIDDFSAFEMSD